MPPPDFSHEKRLAIEQLGLNKTSRRFMLDRAVILDNAVDLHAVENILLRPALSSRQGSLFIRPADQGAPPSALYIPLFALAGVSEVDSAFQFEAVRVGEAPGGVPVHRCSLTATLIAAVPPDAKSWLAGNAEGKLAPVAIESIGAKIVISVADPATSEKKSVPVVGTVTPFGGERYKLVIEPIVAGLGEIVYNALLRDANLKISVSFGVKVRRIARLRPGPFGQVHPIRRFEQAIVQEDISIDVAAVFAAATYAQRFTLTTSAGSRTIVGPDDLRTAGPLPTEYRELILPGDLSARYPSIRALYFGVVSRRIVMIPARYVLLRDRTTCAATCRALVDSSPTMPSGCMFALDFTLIPDVSPIDRLRLLSEIEALPDPSVRGAILALPSSIDTSQSLLLTPFATTIHFSDGANARSSVELNVQIRDIGVGKPAVACANILLSQLRSTSQPFLTGVVSIRLDAAFPIISVPVQLAFHSTQPMDSSEIVLTRDSVSKEIIISNNSAFPLFLGRLAVIAVSGMTIHELKKELAATESLRIPAPSNEVQLAVLADAELALPAPVPMILFQQLVQMDAVDVQSTRHTLFISADAVPWAQQNIERLEATIVFRQFPDIVVPPVRLSPSQLVDSATVLAPIEQALLALEAVVTIALELRGNTPKRHVSIVHDFSRNPTLVLLPSHLTLT